MADTSTRAAGALDIRAIIAYLIGLYGLILAGLGLFDFSDADQEKTGDLNLNLWAGIGMIVFALAFLLWNKLNPTKVPEGQAERGGGTAPH
jgi:hypothetical protein